MKTQTANLEQRLLVALSARGSQRIGQFIGRFILRATAEVNGDSIPTIGSWKWPLEVLMDLSDEELVSACEREVGR